MKRELIALAVGCAVGAGSSFPSMATALSSVTSSVRELAWRHGTHISAYSTASNPLPSDTQSVGVQKTVLDTSPGTHAAVASYLLSEASSPAPTEVTVDSTEGTGSPGDAVGTTTSTLDPPPAHIAPQVTAAVRGFSESVVAAPQAVAAMAQSVQQHGVAAFLQDDPATKPSRDRLAAALASGLSALSEAITKDMVDGARKANLSGDQGSRQ